MKLFSRCFAFVILLLALVSNLDAQTTLTLNPLASFGPRGDGSIQPVAAPGTSDSLGTSPLTSLDVKISAPGATSAWNPNETTIDQRPTGSTNGFNMRGLTYDPVSGNLIFVDTHTGSGGSNSLSPFSAIYILDANTGSIIGALNTNGIASGSYTHVVPGVSDDGVVYVCNQTTGSSGTPLKIYRWLTANTNDPNFNTPPVVAFTNLLTPSVRWGETMDVRGSGTNTQIIMGSGTQSGLAQTNLLFLTTTNGTNFTAHYLGFPGISNGVFNDGIAFGPGNTVFCKQVGQPLLFLRFDPNQFTNTLTVYTNNSIISSFAASSVNDPLLNISALAYDPVNQLLAGLEEIGGTATGGRGKVWLFRTFDPTNRAPSILASRIFTPNFQKTTAPMGYVRFGNGRLYSHASNNGFLVSTVDSVALSAPTFTTDLPAATRVIEGSPAHFEVFAVADVTNYQWYSNNVAIPGANTYFYNLQNASTNMNSPVFKVVAMNAAGSSTSANSTLTVVSTASFFHPNLLWSRTANTVPLTDPTNYITSGGGASTPNERTIAYNALSNQLLIVRGPTAFGSLRIFVVNPDTGEFLYTLKTNGITPSGNLQLCGIAVSDEGAVYAASVNTAAASGGNDSSFKLYRWADSGSNTLPVVVFGTNSSAASGNPIADLVGANYYRFGDGLAVHGAGNNTEIVLDCNNPTRYASILRPVPDGFMTNWTETGYLLQNISGSYGSDAYGTTVGRGVGFGPVLPTPFGNLPTFYEKRYNAAAGAPLSYVGYNAGGGLAPLAVANSSANLYTNGPIAVNATLSVGAAINFVGGVGSDNTTAADTLNYYDLTDPSQAVLLSSQLLPGSATGGFHKGNANAIGQVIFGFNPATQLNYMFVIDGNNGIAAYSLVGGVTPPPKIIAQPHNLRVLEGSSGSLTVSADQPATIQWWKGTNSPVNTGITGSPYNIASALASDAGDYFAIVTNVNGSVTSSVAHVSVAFSNDNYTLTRVWQAADTNLFPYATFDGGANTPNERAFAYNALSNQLIVVRCPPASTAYIVWVVDATTGSNLYTLNTSGVIHEGQSEVSGSNPIDLVGAAAADDGAVYICNETPNASGGANIDTTKMFHVYRWANTAPSTAPTVVFEGDPSGQLPGINERWGDVMAARGSGTNTELIVNSQDGLYGAVLRPTNSSLLGFTNAWFNDVAGGGSIGRSIQFGPTNSVFEKRKGAGLVLSKYSLTDQSCAALLSVDSSVTLGGVAVDTPHNLTAGVDFVGSTTAPLKPDAVALYDISDPGSPMLIKRYNFPSNQVANANVICETIIYGNRVFALDGNNGMMAFYIDPPVNSMVLKFSQLGGNVNLSWGNNQAILQGTPSIAPPAVWTDLTSAGVTNSVQPANGSNQFYRLIQRL
jgi:hypothetical protein